ncbi:hypothetical protein P175DRAFT_0532490 [Aspergillus ochraceoroseus IBT 24754]|uniref:Uncharacterized protein n=1 Tax=Aspergillus ochraceoroseus IBT 24754 TaxID=1392256 RepID=A0A2T5LXV4_9EURO|nr:uncharacterized protein P175DRAFT_0532490 [Aspergillus ochraceoroseus IBT 24754]PTU21116.1 hypothetical protein P175DRAFT_0532490 [Aspergillus ochraceoroseus IBT 24754]
MSFERVTHDSHLVNERYSWPTWSADVERRSARQILDLCYPQSFAILTFPALIFPALTFPALTFPALTFPALTFPALTFPALTFPALTFPALTFPALTCPALTCPALTCPALTCPALTCPALTCPALTCPALLPHLSLFCLIRRERKPPGICLRESFNNSLSLVDHGNTSVLILGHSQSPKREFASASIDGEPSFQGVPEMIVKRTAPSAVPVRFHMRGSDIAPVSTVFRKEQYSTTGMLGNAADLASIIEGRMSPHLRHGNRTLQESSNFTRLQPILQHWVIQGHSPPVLQRVLPAVCFHRSREDGLKDLRTWSPKARA